MKKLVINSKVFVCKTTQQPNSWKFMFPVLFPNNSYKISFIFSHILHQDMHSKSIKFLQRKWLLNGILHRSLESATYTSFMLYKMQLINKIINAIVCICSRFTINTEDIKTTTIQNQLYATFYLCFQLEYILSVAAMKKRIRKMKK